MIVTYNNILVCYLRLDEISFDWSVQFSHVGPIPPNRVRFDLLRDRMTSRA